MREGGSTWGEELREVVEEALNVCAGGGLRFVRGEKGCGKVLFDVVMGERAREGAGVPGIETSGVGREVLSSLDKELEELVREFWIPSSDKCE